MTSKNVRQSPSEATSTKAQILSQLTATRNIIRNKFRQAYIDRMERERDISDALEPVTSKIASLQSKNEDLRKTTENKLLSSTLAEQSPNISNIDEDNVKNDAFFDARQRRHEASGTSSLFTPFVPRWNNLSPNARLKKIDAIRRQVKPSGISPISPDVENVLREHRIRAAVDQSHSPTADVQRHYESMETPRPKLFKLPMIEETLDDKATTPSTSVASRTRTQPRVNYKEGGGMHPYNESIDANFIPYNINDHVIYEYFDDPNELCDRLRLLVSSRMAGNTNHMQEINSIIEELRELKYIS